MLAIAKLKNSCRTVLSLLLVFTFMLPGVALAQRSDPDLRRGQAAIDKLGPRLPEVARRNGKSADELRRLFRQDDTLWLDRTDALLYIDPPAPADTLEPANALGPTTAEVAPYPLSETFNLHSRPGSNRVIYLDFDGHVTSGTAWNNSYGEPIVSAPYSKDSDPNTFNDDELEDIQYIWQRVAEDFAPFDVDVTTEDPGQAAITRSSLSDQVYGTRTVISPTNFTGMSIGGIAYVGVFDHVGDFYKPNFVMTSGLGNNEKNIAEAASHEVGHNVGLSHDGTSTTGYYTGHGDWAPIMGVGYYRPITQWSKGEYPDANQFQDDYVVMGNNGVGYIPDDHGNSTANPTVLTGTNVSSEGIVSETTDVDYFQFTTGAGNVTLDVTGAPPSPNLDILAEVRDDQGNLVASSDPIGVGAVNFNLNLAAGTYFLSVEGVGEGNLVTGYSDYGSLGKYTVSGTLSAVTGQPPVAAASASPTSGEAPLPVQFSSVGSDDPDGTIVSYSWNFGDGNTSSVADPLHTYAAAGNYTATLTVTDNDGNSDADTVNVTVSPPNQAPTAAFSSDVSFLEVDFTDSSSDTDGSIVSWSWDFGDGNSSTAQNPTHSYGSAGTYNVTLLVTDDDGATDSVTNQVTVSDPPSSIDDVATGDIFGSGDVSGSYIDTHASGGAFQTITETHSGGPKRSRRQSYTHDWTFDVTGGAGGVVVSVEAWVSGSEAAEFYYSTDGGATYELMFSISNTAPAGPVTYALPGSASGTVRLRVLDAEQVNGEAVDSVHVDHLVITSYTDPGTPPAAPSNMVVNGTTAGSVDLSFTDNSDDEFGFEIWRATSDPTGVCDAGTVVGTAPASAGMFSTVNFTDNTVAPNTTYWYWATSFNGAGTSSSCTNAVSTTTPPAPAISLSLSTYKVKGVQHVDLSWSGATTSNVDIYRDGAVVASPANTGSYTDNIGQKGGGSYVYKVCEAGTSVCSPEQTAVF